jgi:hypothetical protein
LVKSTVSAGLDQFWGPKAVNKSTRFEKEKEGLYCRSLRVLKLPGIPTSVENLGASLFLIVISLCTLMNLGAEIKFQVKWELK